ncbi:MAG: hypothetical protein ACUVUG_04280 [Candidatus Aminicenantia bacterium]
MIEKIIKPLLEIEKEISVLIFDAKGDQVFLKGFEGVDKDLIFNVIATFFRDLSERNYNPEEVRLRHPAGEILVLSSLGKRVVIQYPKIKTKSVLSFKESLKIKLNNFWSAQETPGVWIMEVSSDPTITYDSAQIDEEKIKEIEKSLKIHFRRAEIGNLSGKTWIFEVKKGKGLEKKILLSESAMNLLDLKSGDPVIMKPSSGESQADRFFG